MATEERKFKVRKDNVKEIVELLEELELQARTVRNLVTKDIAPMDEITSEDPAWFALWDVVEQIEGKGLYLNYEPFGEGEGLCEDLFIPLDE